MQFREYLIQKEACTPALTWLGDRTAEQAWAECPRPDWLLWLAGRAADPSIHRPLVRIALECARTIPSDDARVIGCLATVDRWLAGEDVDLEVAERDAWAARDARDAQAARAAWAAQAAARAAGAVARVAQAAAWAVAQATGDAARAAWAVAQATGDAAWAAGATGVPDRVLCAIVRKHIPWFVIGPLIERA